MRFDRDVLAYFQSSGPGWQTRMNAALKEWIQAQPRASRL
ncbi:BrnA antitoxin family protein [Allochromatium tepidum]